MILPVAAPQPVAAEEIGRNVYQKIFWRFLPFLILCYGVSYLDRVNISFAKLQMAPAMGMSETVFGIGAGVFFIGYFLFELPSNLMLQRVGARIWIARIMITWGIVSAAFVFIKTPAAFYTLRFLLGAAEAGFYPGVILFLTYWFPARRRARVIALFMWAIPMAGLLGNPLSGWILQEFHRSSLLRGWQWIFLIEAIPALLCGVAALFILKDGIAQATWLTDAEKAFLRQEIEADLVHDGRSPHSVAEALKSGRVWQMSLIYFPIVLGQYGLTFWMPTLIRAAGVKGNLHVGLVSAIPFLCALFAMYFCGRSADQQRERRWHLIVPALAGAVGFCMAPFFAHSVSGSLASLSLAAAGVLTCAPLFWSLPTAFLSGAAAAAGIAMINSIGNLAGFASPLLVGYLRDATHTAGAGMFVLAGFMILGSAGVWLTPKEVVNR